MSLSGTEPLNVAIDGPAGSGKSSVAREVAERLGLVHIDTGAMYRALTWVAMNEGLSVEDGPALAKRLRRLSLEPAKGRLVVDGIPAGERIRQPEVDALVSAVASFPEVRTAMQERQRAFGWGSSGVVMEGRDIGTVVLPTARCKIFLTASVEERARRRALQSKRGESPEVLTRIMAEMRERDARDSSRPHSPLRLSPDGHLVDNTSLGRSDTVARIVELARASVPEAVPTTDPYWIRQYGFFKPRVQGLFHRCCHVEVHGAAHQQELRGGAIYACNHTSNWDPLILGAHIDRQVAFLAKSDLFRWPLGPILRWVGAVPIVRGRYDATAFERTREHLRAGRNVAIFPEGTRKPPGRPGPVKRGLGILVESAGAPWMTCFIRTDASLRNARNPETPAELWIAPPSRPYGLEAMRTAGLDPSVIQARIGDLCLAQFRALAQRAQENRPRPEFEPARG